MRHATKLLLAFALVGCSSVPSPAPAGAQEVVLGADTRVIHVDASATVQRAPDRAVVHLAVETVAPTARGASQQNAETMERVLAALLRLDIEREDIRTLRVELHPRYDHRRPQPEPARAPEIIGYTAINQVIVTLDDVGRVGTVIDTAIEAGANRVNGISFELRDPEAAHHEALRLAIQKARREAEVIASSLGEQLGPVLRVTTSAYQPMYRMAPAPPMMDARVEVQAATPVEPGELDVHANVNITFTIGT